MPNLIATAHSVAALCGMLGLLFAWMHWRHRDPGAAWFAVGFLALFVLYAFGLQAPAEQPIASRAATAVGALAILGLGFGLVDYVGDTPGRALWWRLAIVAPVALALLALPFGPLPRGSAHALIALSLCLMALLTWMASKREARVGHRLVALALLAHPVTLAVLLWRGLPIYELRYVLLFPIGLLGTTLFAVSLTRARLRVEHELAARQAAQAELARLNASLESQVAVRTAELQAMVAGLESFNRSVSHDLRGPLGGIAGLTRLAATALEKGDTARLPAMLSAVADQADTLAALVHDLLLLARVHDAPLNCQPVDLAGCVQAALSQLHLAGAPTDRVQVEAASALLNADPGLLRQVLVNLIGNGLKFSRDAPAPRVRVHARREAQRWLLAVHDNGAGFDPARAGELFEPFRRLHGGYEGTGVGLTIVRRIVERHGGSVWAEGRPGDGASFYVALPA